MDKEPFSLLGPKFLSIHKGRLYYVFICALAFCLGFGPVYLLVPCLVVLVFFLWEFKAVSFAACLLFLFSLSYYALAFLRADISLAESLVKVFCISAVYSVGLNIDFERLPGWPFSIINVIGSYAFGVSLYAIASSLLTMTLQPDLVFSRKFLSIWDLSELRHGAALSDYFMPISLIVPSLLFGETGWFKRTFGSIRTALLLMLFGGSFYLSICYKNRRYVYFVVILYATGLLYSLARGKIKTIFFAAFVPLLLIPFFFLYGSELQETFSGFIGRIQSGGVLGSTRYSLWADGLFKAIEYPFGGFAPDQNIEEVSWFHCFWLDVSAKAGIIPVFFIFIFQVMHLKDVFSLFRSHVPSFVVCFIFLQIIGIFFVMQFGTVLDGAFRYFLYSIFIFGVTHNVAMLSKNDAGV